MTKTLTECYEMFKGECGDGDKGTFHSYIDIYEKYFSSIQHEKFNLLEIGILNGKSIKMWCEFFTNANIFGVDVNEKTHLNLADNRTFIFHANAARDTFIEYIADYMFRVIIDDGSHLLQDQIASFNILKGKIEPKGLYIIEDVLPEHIEPIQARFGNCFNVLDLRHERTSPDNILMIYENM